MVSNETENKTMVLYMIVKSVNVKIYVWLYNKFMPNGQTLEDMSFLEILFSIFIRLSFDDRKQYHMKRQYCGKRCHAIIVSCVVSTTIADTPTETQHCSIK